MGAEAGFRIPSSEPLLPNVVPGFGMICGPVFTLSAVSSEGELSTRGGKMVKLPLDSSAGGMCVGEGSAERPVGVEEGRRVEKGGMPSP